MVGAAAAVGALVRNGPVASGLEAVGRKDEINLLGVREGKPSAPHCAALLPAEHSAAQRMQFTAAWYKPQLPTGTRCSC